jgi:hypothetical protein
MAWSACARISEDSNCSRGLGLTGSFDGEESEVVIFVLGVSGVVLDDVTYAAAATTKLSKLQKLGPGASQRIDPSVAAGRADS